MKGTLVGRVARGAGWAFALIGAVLLLPYGLTPSFHYPPAAPFAGDRWYNPYADARGTWRQVALHDHGLDCCLGTAERHSDEQMAAYYRSLGYDVALVSDHQRLSFLPGLQVYEHGMNILKTHQLVIGARRVDWLDFPLFQSTDDKQYVLRRLRGEAALVGIAHPEIRHGYSMRDLRRLTGYDFMEVLHEGFSYEPWWDEALSAGRLSWVTGSDDAHGLGRPSKMGLSWTMLRATSTAPAALVSALRGGRSYAVAGEHGVNDVRLRDVAIHGDTLIVTTDPGATSFTFVGQGGHVRSVVHASSRATYVLRPDDSYIRTVIRTPRTALLLNPVVRTSGDRPRALQATPALAATWGGRTALLLTLLALAWGFGGRLRRAAGVAQRGRSMGTGSMNPRAR